LAINCSGKTHQFIETLKQCSTLLQYLFN